MPCTIPLGNRLLHVKLDFKGERTILGNLQLECFSFLIRRYATDQEKCKAVSFL